MNYNSYNSDNATGTIEVGILGSTGSIGTQTLDIVSEYPARFRASLLTAGKNWRLLAEQARKYLPRRVVIADETAYPYLRDALSDLPVEVAAGAEAIAEAATMPELDTVVTAMVGYSGLIPTVRAIQGDKRIALANKETLVVAGEIITRLLEESDSEIVPVDSEHSAIFQCLQGESSRRASKILLTASGGPFRTISREELGHVTVADALNHPNWDMGAKVTIDSASMMNKGFEMIEAKWLFGCPADKIEIVVHPQSIVHSMVEFNDGSIKAQLGLPDMHIPIRYALAYPDRLPSSTPALSLPHYANLTFEAPDYDKFPMLGFAFDAIRMGGNMPCILNAANEIGVAAFLRGEISFTSIPLTAQATMERTPFETTVSLEDLVETNREARSIAEQQIRRLSFNRQ